MVFAAITFSLSLVLIVILFVLKRWEEVHDCRLVPRTHEALDRVAHNVEDLYLAFEKDLQKVPPEMAHLARACLHQMALAAARFARFLEHESHRFADLVSHKHRFERRAPRSEFLNKVMEHKNGNSQDGTTNV